MKYFLLLLASVFNFSTSAATLNFINEPLRSQEIINFVQKSVEYFLTHDGQDISTEVVSELKDPRVVIVEKAGKIITAVEITSSVEVDVMNPDTLEVLSTRTTFCQTRLEVVGQSFKDAGTICDFNPINNDIDFYQDFEGIEE